jgi:hypothetical protein
VVFKQFEMVDRQMAEQLGLTAIWQSIESQTAAPRDAHDEPAE